MTAEQVLDHGTAPAGAPAGVGRPLAANGAAGLAQRLARHWLAAANLAALVFVALALAAPTLMAAGWVGPAAAIYEAFGFVCHQWPFRSFFLYGREATYSFETLSALAGSQAYSFIGSPELGYKLAFCERDLAIYSAILLGGLVFAALRARVRPLSLPGYLLLCLPIGLDGFTQLLGWRESTWELRLLTGSLFGLASVWLVYPRLERALARSGLLAPDDGAGA